MPLGPRAIISIAHSHYCDAITAWPWVWATVPSWHVERESPVHATFLWCRCWSAWELAMQAQGFSRLLPSLLWS